MPEAIIVTIQSRYFSVVPVLDANDGVGSAPFLSLVYESPPLWTDMPHFILNVL